MTINTDVLIRHFSFVIPTEIERHHHSSVSASILFTYHRCSRFPFCIFDFDVMIYGSQISSKHLLSKPRSATPQKTGSHKRKAIIAPLQPAENEAQKRPQSLGQVHQDQSHPNDAEGRLLQMCGNAA